MITTMLYPELVTKLVVWNIVGGVYGSFVLGGHYIMPSILAVRGMGIKGLLHVGEWKERIAENPGNSDRILALDADEFLKVMLRWLNAFVSKPGQTIPGVPDEMFDNITVPTLIIRGGENDWDHPKRTSLEVSCLIKGSKLIDPPWPEDAWERAGEKFAASGGTKFCLFDTWVQAAPAILDFLEEVEVMLAGSHADDLDLAVQRGLQRGVHPTLRDSPEVVLAHGHLDDVPAVVGRDPLNLTAQAESGQHALRIVIGATAHVRQDTGRRAAHRSRRKPWRTTRLPCA